MKDILNVSSKKGQKKTAREQTQEFYKPVPHVWLGSEREHLPSLCWSPGVGWVM